MASRISESLDPLPPLEQFVRDYAETWGGAWDQVEPEVYDLLLPQEQSGAGPDDVLRVAFDPEAIAEHPGSQLATLGSPVIDRMLAGAVARGRLAEMYAVGLNLHPHGLESRLVSAIRCGSAASVQPRRTRAMQFPQALFWFDATFVSDQREQELLCVGIDLHHGRQVRHTDLLLDHTKLAEAPAEPLPEAPHQGLGSAYRIARQRAARTLSSLANARRREVEARAGRQSARMARYYGQMRQELEEQSGRGGAHDPARQAARLQALAREQQLRIAELQAKSTLRVRARLLSLLIVRQPKLLVRCAILAKDGRRGEIDVVWDPLTESVEAPQCPGCGNSTYDLSLDRAGNVICPGCPAPARRKP